MCIWSILPCTHIHPRTRVFRPLIRFSSFAVAFAHSMAPWPKCSKNVYYLCLRSGCASFDAVEADMRCAKAMPFTTDIRDPNALYFWCEISFLLRILIRSTLVFRCIRKWNYGDERTHFAAMNRGGHVKMESTMRCAIYYGWAATVGANVCVGAQQFRRYDGHLADWKYSSALCYRVRDWWDAIDGYGRIERIDLSVRNVS